MNDSKSDSKEIVPAQNNASECTGEVKIPLSNDWIENVSQTKGSEDTNIENWDTVVTVPASLPSDTQKKITFPTDDENWGTASSPSEVPQLPKETDSSIKLPKINFSAMQKTHEEDEQKVLEKKKMTMSETTPQVVVQEKVPELFGNYEPSFDGRATKFFKRLRELRLKPKTRNSLVFWLIFCTATFIWYLFYFHPDKHSIFIYKTTIVEDVKKITSKKTFPPKNVDTVQNTSTWLVSESWSESKTVTSHNTTSSWSTSTQREELRKEKIRKYFSK